MPSIQEKREQEALDYLVSQFPKRYRVKEQMYILGFLKALATGDGYIASQVEAVRDQSITATATGKYLDSGASRYGIIRGVGAGVQDRDFRELIPLLGMSPKTISHTLQKIIDVVYGPYATHANTTSSAPAPYSFQNGSYLNVLVDGKVLNIFFQSSDVVNTSSVTAQEIANIITTYTGGKAIGSVVTDTRSGDQYVNIRTSTIGPQGFVQVLGGELQRTLRFPQIRPIIQAVQSWDVSHYKGTDEMVYTVTGGTDPGFVAAGIKRGDYVTIRSDSGFTLANTGTFIVTQVQDGSFRCINGNGVSESVTTTYPDSFTFFLPNKGNILLSQRPATVLETGPMELTVILPVTSPIVKRTLLGGHHFHGGVSTVKTTTNDSLTLSSVINFPASGAIHVISAREVNSATCSSVTADTITLVEDISLWKDRGAVYCPTTDSFFYYEGVSGKTLQNVVPAPSSKLQGATLHWEERYAYTSVVGNSLQGVYPAPQNLLGMEVASAGAETPPGYEGSYLYDKESPFQASASGSVITQKIQLGSSQTVLQVEDVSDFDAQGFFVLEYGTTSQEGPIRYYGKVGTQALIIDPSHTFQFDHLAGTRIRMISQVGPVTPRKNGQDLAAYLTSTAPARDLLASYIRDILAAGVTLKLSIKTPDEKWPVLGQLYSTDPLATTLA